MGNFSKENVIMSLLFKLRGIYKSKILRKIRKKTRFRPRKNRKKHERIKKARSRPRKKTSLKDLSCFLLKKEKQGKLCMLHIHTCTDLVYVQVFNCTEASNDCVATDNVDADLYKVNIDI